MPCPSPVVVHHFGKHCVAPIAPVKWHKPEAMLLRLGVRESSGWAGDTQSQCCSVWVTEHWTHSQQSNGNAVFTVQEGTCSFTHSGNRWKIPEYGCVWEPVCVFIARTPPDYKMPVLLLYKGKHQDIWSGALCMAKDVTPLLMQRCSCVRVFRWAYASSVV